MPRTSRTLAGRDVGVARLRAVRDRLKTLDVPLDPSLHVASAVVAHGARPAERTGISLAALCGARCACRRNTHHAGQYDRSDDAADPTLIDVFVDFTLLLSRWLYPSILEAAKGHAQVHHDHSAAARASNAATTPATTPLCNSLITVHRFPHYRRGTRLDSEQQQRGIRDEICSEVLGGPGIGVAHGVLGSTQRERLLHEWL